MSDNFIESIRATMAGHAMLPPGEKVLAAVSGGADSVALLLALQELGHPAEVAHFDHGTRGDESAEDARFVQELAEQVGVPCHAERRSVPAEAAAASMSFEAYARKQRYAFLLYTARTHGCAAIATGHHADDQAETVLLRLLRGTAPGGLAGIPPARMQEGIRIIRPLIDCTRRDIETWLRERKQAWQVDRTNEDLRHPRNRIRHELLPSLRRQFNPQVRDALLRLAEAQRCENDLLDALAKQAVKRCIAPDNVVDRAAFSALPPALQRRCILELAWRQGAECTYERVVQAVAFIASAPTGNKFDLGGGVMLYNGRVSTETLPPSAPPPAREETPLRAPGETTALGYRFSVRLLLRPPEAPLAEYCTSSRQVFDADAMVEGIAVRTRQDGDRFVPFGMSQSRKLSDYFIDLGLPAPDRDRVPLVLAHGKIAWIVGHATSAETAVGPLTRRILEIEAEPCD